MWHFFQSRLRCKTLSRFFADIPSYSYSTCHMATSKAGDDNDAVKHYHRHRDVLRFNTFRDHTLSILTLRKPKETDSVHVHHHQHFHYYDQVGQEKQNKYKHSYGHPYMLENKVGKASSSSSGKASSEMQ